MIKVILVPANLGKSTNVQGISKSYRGRSKATCHPFDVFPFRVELRDYASLSLSVVRIVVSVVQRNAHA